MELLVERMIPLPLSSPPPPPPPPRRRVIPLECRLSTWFLLLAFRLAPLVQQPERHRPVALYYVTSHYAPSRHATEHYDVLCYAGCLVNVPWQNSSRAVFSKQRLCLPRALMLPPLNHPRPCPGYRAAIHHSHPPLPPFFLSVPW